MANTPLNTQEHASLQAENNTYGLFATLLTKALAMDICCCYNWVAIDVLPGVLPGGHGNPAL